MGIVELTDWDGARLAFDVLAIEWIKEEVVGCIVVASGIQHRIKDDYNVTMDKVYTAIKKVEVANQCYAARIEVR